MEDLLGPKRCFATTHDAVRFLYTESEAGEPEPEGDDASDTEHQDDGEDGAGQLHVDLFVPGATASALGPPNHEAAQQQQEHPSHPRPSSSRRVVPVMETDDAGSLVSI